MKMKKSLYEIPEIWELSLTGKEAILTTSGTSGAGGGNEGGGGDVDDDP